MKARPRRSTSRSSSARAAPDGRHEVATVLQRVDLADEIELEVGAEHGGRGLRGGHARPRRARSARRGGRRRGALACRSRSGSRSQRGSAAEAPTPPRRFAWRTRRSPNRLPQNALHELAAGLGADVPFFLTDGPQLGTGDGTDLAPLDLPQDYWVVLVLPTAHEKESTARCLRRVRRREERGFEERREALLRRPRGSTIWPRSRRTTSPLRRSPHELRARGRLQGRRLWSRAGRLRPLRRRAPRPRRASRRSARGRPGSRNLLGSVDRMLEPSGHRTSRERPEALAPRATSRDRVLDRGRRRRPLPRRRDPAAAHARRRAPSSCSATSGSAIVCGRRPSARPHGSPPCRRRS